MQKTKPARVQVSQQQLDEYLREKKPEGGTYNIWHHRYSGLERDFNKQSMRPKFKVDIAKDAGDTVGSRNKNAYFCLFFAKGICAKGPKCEMWHRVPSTEDAVETTIDCFGRDKFTEFRQDMGGVGGFIRENKTLYVGRIAITSDVKDVIQRQFGQFGPLDRVRILGNRGVAFVTYETRANAEFAREAMMNQSLENNEIINVRWATVDPKATANRLDADDNRRETERAEARLLSEESNEAQDLESDLPAEFTTLKRDVDEDGFSKMESHIKRQKQEDEAKSQATLPIADTQTAESLYGYTQDYNNYYQQQAQYYQQQPQLVEQEQKKAGGIISEKVLANLKSLSNNGSTNTKVIAESAKTNKTGLSNLADYGSDSEEE